MRPALLILPAAALAASAVARPAFAASTAGAECDDILPREHPTSARRRLVPEDLARLRDIGPTDPASTASPPFAISPDGTRVAFQLRRADPKANAYCLAMAVMDLAPAARPRIVDSGGELLVVRVDARGRGDVATGVAKTITPRWSPDGRWVAFLKRSGGTTQVWRAQADGSGSGPLTHAGSDVVDFRIGQDGTSLVYATRPQIDRARAAAAEEALAGFHYDDRFAWGASNRPFPPSSTPRELDVLDLATGLAKAAGAADADVMASLDGTTGIGSRAAGAQAGRVWIDREAMTGGAAPGALHAVAATGGTATCRADACSGASDAWRLDGERIRFFRREGWARASTAIYEWILRNGSVRRLYATDDALVHCAPIADRLLCLAEGSLQPRRLEWLDPATGGRQTLFDPNPELEALAMGRVERLRWRNAFGLQALGDLVRPVGYRPGRRYPLIVVQYDTRGFLRGGTGDEYPIQAFANRDYAVLSIRRPIDIGLVRGARSAADIDRLDLKNFADMRSAASSIAAGVKQAIATGVADPRKIGITGLSDGATQAVWALLHTRLFAAAAMSSCCYDTTQSMRIGPAAARYFHEVGFPRMADRNFAFWSAISLSLNARRVRTPILLQLADEEVLSGLETYTVLRETGAPVDLFVFPDEHHIKWQPAHRLAVYRRAIDWFDYWLKDLRPAAPDRQAELRHWDGLRSQMLLRRPM
jgi:dipeptidyl aminopeptidase/acylaminoacyl peptidase